MAKRPCLISAVFRLKVRSALAAVRPSGSKGPPRVDPLLQIQLRVAVDLSAAHQQIASMIGQLPAHSVSQVRKCFDQRCATCDCHNTGVSNSSPTHGSRCRELQAALHRQRWCYMSANGKQSMQISLLQLMPCSILQQLAPRLYHSDFTTACRGRHAVL